MNEKQCKICDKKLGPFYIQSVWSFVNEEKKIILVEFFYCVVCGTFETEIQNDKISQ